jgi:hypothetical protein
LASYKTMVWSSGHSQSNSSQKEPSVRNQFENPKATDQTINGSPIENPLPQISNLEAVMKAYLSWKILAMGKTQEMELTEPTKKIKINLTSRA